MEDAFGIVVVVVSAVALVVAVIALATSGRSYEQIGRGGMSIGDERQAAGRAGAGGGGAPVDAAERDAEIRQMLTARNARREARGEPPIDVEAELRALTAPAVDPELREEIRELVVSRNARRVARGRPPLDVDAEVERRLREYGA